MKRRAKTLIIGFVLVSIILVVAVFSQYAFIVAIVEDPFEDNAGMVSHKSLVLVRKVDTSQNLTGRIIGYWWILKYYDGNDEMHRAVFGIDRVTNDNATHVSVCDETDDPLRPRRTHTICRANITGEFVTIFMTLL